MKAATRLPAEAKPQAQIVTGAPRPLLHIPEGFSDPETWEDGQSFVMVKHHALLWELMPYTSLQPEKNGAE